MKWNHLYIVTEQEIEESVQDDTIQPCSILLLAPEVCMHLIITLGNTVWHKTVARKTQNFQQRKPLQIKAYTHFNKQPIHFATKSI